MLAFLETGADDLTLGEMRQRCVPDLEYSSLAELHIEQEVAASRSYSILAHKPNYILAGAYNQRGWESHFPAGSQYENDDVELQYQFSLKVPLWVSDEVAHDDKGWAAYMAFTNRAFWQAYNSENSEPFRETNYEPEAWLEFRRKHLTYGAGFVHQSNGQSGTRSRSWNRLYATVIFEKWNFLFNIKPWIWISKDKSTSDNPDIDDYMGHGEIRAFWQSERRHVISMMLRNQLESGFERGAVELGWSSPLFGHDYLKFYAQYFYGYGESLIDYNNKVNRIGLGISVTDWLD